MTPTQIDQKRLRNKLSRAALWPWVWRYGLGLLAFALLLLLAIAFRYFSIQFDFTLLVIAMLLGVAWYGGTGPGLLLAILLEIATLALSNPQPISWPKFIFAEFNRTVLLMFLVLLVSSRKKAEHRLREQHEHLQASEERFSKAFNASPVPMSIVTYKEGRYLEVNESFLRNSGYTRAELIGRTTTEIGIYAEPGERDRLRQILQQQGNINNVEVRRRVKSGEVRAALTSSELITLDGEQCILTTTNDITERKQLEEQLIQAQKMEAVGRLAGGIAHDFNNLLTAIIGYSQIVMSRLNEGDPMRRQIEEIEKAGNRAAALTHQLLAFSRKQVLQPRILNLNAVIADIGKMLQRLIGEDIELRTNLNLLIGSVQADPGQIEQVIMNLAVNARDAMPAGGKLTIETQDVFLDESYTRLHAEVQPGAYVMLAMSDTGTGMDKQTQARIFEPFFTTKEKERGTGLGLSTVYGIVKQSGGHVWVYSEPGKGTTFKIYLPQIEEPPDAQEIRPQVPELLAGTETILLVEDEEVVRNLTRQVLEMNGYTVLESGNPDEALRIAERCRETIHLMITDVVMPGMSGRMLALRLASSRPATKVLYISGYTDDAIVHHGILDSDIPFLQKPFTPDGLLRKVRELLGA
ncbi:MAG: two-component system, cell cycle sensor histidine kinase and response regulator CckA [Blastocatellia bacterium]